MCQRLRIEQYFQVQDYALWDVIENGNSFKPVAQTTTNADGTSTSLIPGPVTTEEKVQKKNDVKARSMLLMALPNEHLMTFNQYKDAKTLFAAIQTRFGESLDSIFNRLQKIVSQLAILGENISQEDLNLKFLRSLPSEWNTHVVVWRNKPDLDTMSFDDLYNNFKIVEQEVKGTTSSSSSLNSQNMAFVSSPSSTNEVNTAYGVSTANTQVSLASTQVSTASTQISTANLSDATIYAFLANQPNGSQLVHKDLEQIHEDDLEEMDLKWQLALLSMRTRRECRGPRNQDSRNMNQDSSRRTINVEETSSKAMLAIDGAGFDWSYMADDEVATNMALMDLSDSKFNKSEFNLATYKRGLASVEEQLVFYKKNEVIFYEQLAILKRDISYKDSEISMLKSELQNLKQEKESNQLKIENFDNASKSLNKLIRSQIPDKSRKEEFQQPEFEGYGPKTSKSDNEDISNEVGESPDASLVEELVSDKLEKKTVFPTVAKIEFVRPKQQEKPVRKSADYNYHQRERVVSGNNYTRVNYNYSSKKAHPSAHKNMVPRAVLQKTGLRSLNTARPVNTAHPKTIGYPQKEDQGYVDSGCSRHMTGNMSYLSDFKEFDGGYLADESQILLKVPRKNNMYIVDMKNIIPKESLNYLVAKATLDESMLWHRRLGKATQSLLFTWVLFLATKDETSGILKSFITEVENLVDKKVKIIRCDNGTEFKNRVMSEFCEKKGIKKEFSNRVLVVKPHNKTPYELFRGRTPALSFMRPFGCHVTILNTLDYLGKFDGKSDEGFFVGYSMNSKAFRVYNIKTRKVEENLHIRFLEDKPIIAGDGPKWLFDIDDDEGVCKESGIADQEKPENSTQGVNTAGTSINTEPDMFSLGDNATLEAIHVDFFGDETEVDMSNITTTYPVPSTPHTRIHKDHSLDYVIDDEGKTHEDLHTCLFACFLSQVEPKKVTQALTDPSWKEAMQDELLQFKLQKVWTLVDLPYDKRAIGTKWVYRNKKDKRGIFVRNKARLVMDVKSAFLYNKIEEEVYVCQPPGFEDLEFPDRVYKVEKALYGLHQAPRAWYETLSTYLLENRFQRGTIDKTLFIKKVKGDILLVQIYVDDIIFRSTKKELCTEFEKLMHKKFQMSSMGEHTFYLGLQVKGDILLVQIYVDDIIFGSTKKELCTEFEKLMHKKFQMSSMGELTFFLGLQVMQKEDGIFISQDKYVDEILKKFGFSTVRIASTPMETSKPLLKDAEAEDVDVHLYRSMIGSLMYLTASRPDIMFVVCACARFQVTPKVSHLHAVKRIFRYLKGQPKLGLWYPKDSPFDLEAYSDSDYAGASLDRKSTTGGCQFLRSRLISWQCKKQTIVANSTTEAEYVSTANCYGQVLWIQNQMLDYRYNFMNTKIFIDNESTTCIVKNPVVHSKTKHIKIRHHFIRDSYEKRLIKVIKIHTDHNVADLLTKALDIDDWNGAARQKVNAAGPS
ncbi:putative ribonuclease H-like domain-containing protein [Tanacetum coccineum]